MRGDEELRQAVDNCHAFGWEAIPGAHVLARRGYFAGGDADRLADFSAALEDDAIDGMWCVRGGYGSMRILEQLDFRALRRRPKAIIGYSDITALHAAIGSRADLVTYHGPTARATLSSFSREALLRAVGPESGAPASFRAPGARTVIPGRVTGPLVGGNLTVLAALCGTPFAPHIDGAILFLEDVNEAVYRIDRMLTQLRLAGLLDRCAGLVFGAFVRATEGEDGGGGRTLDEVLDECAHTLRIPCIAGAPIGHVADQWTLPVGAVIEFDADTRALSG